MKRSRFSEEEIISILRDAEAGEQPAMAVCRKHGISEQTFCRWKPKYGGMEVSEARRLKSPAEFSPRHGVNPGRIDSALRLINAPAATIYSALIDPSAMAQWRPPAGMTGEVLEIDPREGGRFRMALRYGDPAQLGKSGDGADVFESRFIRLELDREVTEAIVFQSDDPAFSGTMLMSTYLRPVGDLTEVLIIARDVPEGIRHEDHLAGLNSTLANLDRFCTSTLTLNR